MPHVGSSTPLAFFVPGLKAAKGELEYLRLQKCAQQATGATPAPCRIQRVECRLGGKNCAIEVGQPHPIDGTPVLAILDLGRQLPYSVFTAACGDEPENLIRKRVYSVTEFA